MNFRDRIISAFQEENLRRKELGERRLTKTDLWKTAGLTSAAATFWFNGDNAADLDTCMKIGPLLRVRGQWLFDGTGWKRDLADGDGNEDHAPVRLVDARASAGRGEIVMSDDVSKILMFRRDWLAKNGARPENTIAFPVRGDSMVDAYIINGAVVLANRAKTEPMAGKVFVVWIGKQLYVKELARRGGIWLARSRNAAKADEYPDIPIDTADSGIVGRAFWCGFEL